MNEVKLNAADVVIDIKYEDGKLIMVKGDGSQSIVHLADVVIDIKYEDGKLIMVKGDGYKEVVLKL